MDKEWFHKIWTGTAGYVLLIKEEVNGNPALIFKFKAPKWHGNAGSLITWDAVWVDDEEGLAERDHAFNMFTSNEVDDQVKIILAKLES